MRETGEAVIGCTTRPYNRLPVEEALDRIAGAGYADAALFRMQGRAVVDAETPSREVTALRRAAEDAGVSISMVIGSTGLEQGLERAAERYRRLIGRVAELGAPWLLDCGTADPSLYDSYRELMCRAAPWAREAGVGIVLKPHGGISATAEDLVRVYRAVNDPGFGICYDPGNVLHYTEGRVRPESDVAGVAPFVTTAVIKDCVRRDGPEGVRWDVQVTPGDGLVDFVAVLAGLVAAGFVGPYYVECVGATDPPAVDRDIAFTRGYVRGILAAVALAERQVHQDHPAPR